MQGTLNVLEGAVARRCDAAGLRLLRFCVRHTGIAPGVRNLPAPAGIALRRLQASGRDVLPHLRYDPPSSTWSPSGTSPCMGRARERHGWRSHPRADRDPARAPVRPAPRRRHCGRSHLCGRCGGGDVRPPPNQPNCRRAGHQYRLGPHVIRPRDPAPASPSVEDSSRGRAQAEHLHCRHLTVQAAITLAADLLGCAPRVSLAMGLARVVRALTEPESIGGPALVGAR